MGLFIQVLSPYTHDDPDVVFERVEQTERFVAKLCKQGHTALSVVTAFHYMCHKEDMELPDTFEFWEDYCYTIMDKADEIYVLRIDGWTESNVMKEIARAMKIGKTVRYFDV